jgi:diketogulonate reductase-like aldo/keto reductase
VIGQGTWEMEADRAAAVRALRRGLDLGMTHIDTAEMYGRGRVEEIVGEAVAGRRDEVFLVSKVLPQNASRRGMLAACGRSLQRLRTDHLDCYLLHWPSRHPLAETIAGFEDLVRAGMIRSWGVSNFNEEEIEEAVRLAGSGRVACNQVYYALGRRDVERYVTPVCERHRITIVAYSPFSQGRFRTHPILEEIARARGATPRQVALRFLVRRPSVVTIPKAIHLRHVEENAGAGRLRLTADEIARIEAALPAPRARRGDVPTL